MTKANKNDLESMSFLAKIDDPQDLTPVSNAFCVLSEVHLSFESKAVVAVVKCWRSEQAYLSGKRAFEAIRIELNPTEGGSDFFSSQGMDGANMQLGPKLLQYLLTSGKLTMAKT